MRASACPQCSGETRYDFVVQDLNQGITDEVFCYRRCKRCALVFLDPVPADLGRYYPKGYHAIPRRVEDLARSLPAEQHKVDLVRRLAGVGKLLEIGPSFGAFSLLAKQSGYAVSALEMDPDCCRFLRDAVGIQVHESSDVPGYVESGETFDVVCLWHSIEHLPDPWRVVDGLGKLLRKGGVLFIATPNPDSLQFRYFGRYWLHLDAPRHVQLIPYPVLAARLIRGGFVPMHVTTRDRGARDCNVAGWRVSVNHALGVEKQNRWVQQIGRIISRLALPLEGREGQGSAYTAAFRFGVGA
jgi:2-polyprenyl-3-methyl-5-hydroxy-6-metoxy-1,4-benzoquinol methylase